MKIINNANLNACPAWVKLLSHAAGVAGVAGRNGGRGVVTFGHFGGKATAEKGAFSLQRHINGLGASIT